MSKHYVTIAAILSITVLEGLAIMQGINGVTLSSAIGVIAGLGGFIAGKKQNGRGQSYAIDETTVRRGQDGD